MNIAQGIPVKESHVVSACLQWLWLHGCYVWRNNSGALKPEGSKRPIRFGLKGSADIIGLTPQGKFLAVECKAGRNKLTDEQIVFGERVKQKGGIYIVAYSVEEMREQLLRVTCLPAAGSEVVR